jgi:molybdate transport system substrate-binding protein
MLLRLKRSARVARVNLWLTFPLLLFACGKAPQSGQSRGSEAITVAVAANMQFAMEELTQAFLEETDIKCELVVSSSGKLTAQIKQGAPFDVFVSANMKYPEEVQNSGLAAAPPKVYAYGKLVLWSMKKDVKPSLALLSDPSIRKIALANPRTAPYGQAALEVLRNAQLLERVEPRLVYGESIAQTNQFVISRAVDMGFTALSVVLSPKLQEKGRWIEVDSELYRPIRQGVVVIRREKAPLEKAVKFYDFLSSEKAHRILEAFGYSKRDE